MSITLTCSNVRASVTVILRSPFVQSSQGASRSVFTSPMDMFQMYRPSRLNTFSCGLSPVVNRGGLLAGLDVQDVHGVGRRGGDGDARAVGETAMWSAR